MLELGFCGSSDCRIDLWSQSGTFALPLVTARPPPTPCSARGFDAFPLTAPQQILRRQRWR